MFETLKKLLVDELQIDPEAISTEAELSADLGINSIELANLIMICEEKFDITIDDDDDIHKLVTVLNKLVDAGNTVLVIEHNLDVIKTADYLIDLGPEGGSGGGKIVACGTPEEVSQNESSYTGYYLRRVL